MQRRRKFAGGARKGRKRVIYFKALLALMAHDAAACGRIKGEIPATGIPCPDTAVDVLRQRAST
jgi:hypothetical protein